MQGLSGQRRWAAWAAILVAAMAMLVAGAVPASATTSASAPGNSWHVAATLGLGASDTASSCPTSTTCWAIEAGELLSSQDGGATWTPETSRVPDDVAALNDLECPKATLCYVTATLDTGDSELLVLHAATIAELAAPTGHTLPTISCPSPRHCLATDGTSVFVTHDGGTHWRTSALPQIVYTVPALACVPGTSRCWIVGDNGETPIIEMSRDDGRHWHSQSAPALTDGMYDVACPTLRTCYAVGANFSDYAVVIGTHDAGSTWTTQSSPVQAYPMRSVSCASESTCWAAGLSPAESPYIFATTDAGGHWDRQDLPSLTSGGNPMLSCPTVSVCSAVSGGLTFATVDGGITWTDTEVPAAVATPQALTCPTRKLCVGVSNDALGRPAALTTSDGGTSWARHDIPHTAYGLRDVDCPTVSACYAIGAGSSGHPGATLTRTLTSTDGGSTWHAHPAIASVVLTTLTCPDASTCLAVGYDRQSAAALFATTDSGGSWHPLTPPPGAFHMNGVSCVSITSCVLITQQPNQPPVAWTTADLGASYQQHTLPEGDFYDLDCAGETCVTVGSDGGDGAIAVSGDGGVTWAPVAVPREVQILGRVSCGSTTACAATGYDFSQGGGPLVVGTTNGGQTWRAHPVPARKEEPIDVACSGASCLASDVSPAGNPLILAGHA